MNAFPLQFEPRRALRAAKILAADPDDLPQVFTIIESLSLDTMNRIYRRMAAGALGRELLDKRPDLVELLADRDALARLPEGTVGRAYLDFVQRENISADGIRAAAAVGATSAASLPAPYDYVNARMRDTHDLWHVVTGISGDVLGETALLAFTLAQIKNPAIALIVAIGLVKTARWAAARPLIFEMYRRGQKAAWLPEQHWETMLARPLDEVRRELRIEPIGDYQQIRTHEVRAAA